MDSFDKKYLNFNVSGKVNTMSIIIMPTNQKVVDEINIIRRKHDPAYSRWMPHINITYPFIEKEKIRELDLVPTITKALANINPFEVVLKQIGSFENKNEIVMYAKPDDSPQLYEIEKEISSLFPNKNEEKTQKFVPHLTLGKFKTISELAPFKQSFKPLKFKVENVYIISRTCTSPFVVSYVIPLGRKEYNLDLRKEQYKMLRDIDNVDEEDLFVEYKRIEELEKGIKIYNPPKWKVYPPESVVIDQEHLPSKTPEPKLPVWDFADNVSNWAEETWNDGNNWDQENVNAWIENEEDEEKVSNLFGDDEDNDEQSYNDDKNNTSDVNLEKELELTRKKLLDLEQQREKMLQEEKELKKKERELENEEFFFLQEKKFQQEELKRIKKQKEEEKKNQGFIAYSDIEIETKNLENEKIAEINFDSVELVDPLSKKNKKKKMLPRKKETNQKETNRGATARFLNRRNQPVNEEAKNLKKEQQLLKNMKMENSKKLNVALDNVRLSKLMTTFKRLIIVQFGKILQEKKVNHRLLHDILFSKLPRDVGIIFTHFSSKDFYEISCGGCKKTLGPLTYKKDKQRVFIRDKNKPFDEICKTLLLPYLKQNTSLLKVVFLSDCEDSFDSFHPLVNLANHFSQNLMSLPTKNSSTLVPVPTSYFSFLSSIFSHPSILIDHLFLKEIPPPKETTSLITYNAKKVKKVLESLNISTGREKPEKENQKELDILFVASKIKGWITKQKKKDKKKLPSNKFSLANSIRKNCFIVKEMDYGKIIKHLFDSEYVEKCLVCNSWNWDKFVNEEIVFHEKQDEEEDDTSYCVKRIQKWMKNAPSASLPNTESSLVGQICSFQRTKKIPVEPVLEKLIERKVISMGSVENNYQLEYL